MPFLKNAWYVAAWGRDVGRALFARWILDEPVLRFRREEGVAVALADRCAHRFAPLSTGRLSGDIVEYRYRGLRFDGAGVCVHSPHGDGAVPNSARVRAYPLVERHRVLWIWMGEPQRADPSLIPVFSFLVDSENHTTVTAMSRFKANFEHITDNLTDPSHVSYLHAELFGTTDIAPSEMEVSQVGTTVSCNRLCRDDRSRPPIRNALVGYEGPVDFWLDMRCDPPSNLR
jgi:phenylpropionate dioxygenase-like ring-hydroxylating dioxygenase large terminal subunit